MKLGTDLVCDLCNTTIPADSKQAAQWDWFTGYLPETVHFCPKCRYSKERHAMFTAAWVKEQS